MIAGTEYDEAKHERIFLFVRDGIQFNSAYPQDIAPGDVLANGMGVRMQGVSSSFLLDHMYLSSPMLGIDVQAGQVGVEAEVRCR